MSEPEQPAAPSADSPSTAAEQGHPEHAEHAEHAKHAKRDEDETTLDAASDDGADGQDDELVDEFGPPFVPKTFGGAFVWAKGEGFVTTVLRVKEGKSVPVATSNRRDMHVMLTGGRAVLEVDDGDEVDRVELMPAGPLRIDAGKRYRLIAMTEVEIFTVYSSE